MPINKVLLFKGTFALAVTMAMNYSVSVGARLSVIVEHSSKQYSVMAQLVKDLADVVK